MSCFGAMRDYLPSGATGNSSSLDLPEGATVGHLIDALGAPGHLVFALLVDDERADVGHALTEGAKVTLMPPFTGGAASTPMSRE